jgi:MFS-type transporter involved in bile tolerance (Atg22 family)
VFGFHRAMDHAGAVCGPLLASAFLFFYPGEYRTLFALTIVPGIIVILILLYVPDIRREPLSGGIGGAAFSAADTNLSGEGETVVTPIIIRARPDAAPPGPSQLPATFYHAMAVILLFSLGNASDAFLLLRFADVGIAAFWIPLLWSAVHVVKATSSLVGGSWSDTLGRRRVIALGWLIYAAVYAAFALTDSPPLLITVFLTYGVYFGLTEGAEKAWVADLAPAASSGSAFGIYNAVVGGGSLLASLLFGFIWTRVSAPAAFFTGAGFALAATGLLYSVFSRGPEGVAHPQ